MKSTLVFYVPEIDGLRAVSILLVLVLHLDEYLLPGGYIGVDVFFVISGFLITTNLCREHAECGAISLRSFYKRRILRLWPASATMLLTYLVFATSISSWESHVITVFVSALGLMNWQRALTDLPQGFLGHTWSLAVEEQFYLIWPTLLGLLLTRDKPTRIYALLGIVSAAALWRLHLITDGAPLVRTYNGLDTRADALLIGCLSAIAPHNDLPRILKRMWIIPVAFLGFVVTFVPWDARWMHMGGFTLVALAAGWLLIVVTSEEQTLLRDILTLRPLVFIGVVSYSLYLWHYPIIMAMKMAGVSPVAIWIIAPFLSIAVAIQSYRLIEQPFLRMKHRMNFHESGK